MLSRIKVFGPPGTGKTNTLMGDRFGARYLLDQGYKSDDITIVTYRKDSAQDLINKAKEFMPLDEKILKQHIGTIHAICLRLIGRPQVLTSKDIKKFVDIYGYKSIVVKDNDGEDGEYTGNLLDVYSWCKNTCTPLEDWTEYPQYDKIDLDYSTVLKFFQDYELFKSSTGKVDFSDMLQRVIDENILLDTPILLVDEFQDLTPQMFKVFQLWSNWCDYVLIAGDPNQSIYGYAGGTPEFFKNWYADEFKLKRSYRLPDQINYFASSILEVEDMQSPSTFGKTGYSNMIHFMEYDELYPEYQTELHLFRCHYQINAMAFRFAEEGKIFSTHTPYPGWTLDEINIANAMIEIRNDRMLNGYQLAAIINKFPTKMTNISIYGTTDEARRKAFLDKNNLLALKSIIVPEKISKSVLQTKIIESLKSSDPTTYMTTESKLFVAKMQGVMNRTKVITPLEAMNRRLMTFHASKGLEADATFLHTGISAAVEGSVYGTTEQAQAEARVWYVGASRSKEVLYIVNDIGRKYSLPDTQDIPIRNMIPSGPTEEYIKGTAVFADW